MKLFKAITIILAASLTGITQGQETAQFFESPTPLEFEAASYPSTAARMGAEGWVLLNFMVDSNGKTFEPAVVASAGLEVFHKSALRALNRTKWNPATIDGRAIEGGASFLYRYAMEDSEKAVTRVFKRQYEDLGELFKSGAKDDAETLLASMNERGSLNNYENALLALSNFNYFRIFEDGSDENQIDSLRVALNYESYSEDIVEGGGYLPEDLRESARRQLLMLLSNTKKYAEALNVYYLLRESGADVEVFGAMVEQIHQLAGDSSEYSVKGETDKNGLWDIQLFKSGLYIDNLGNSISEFRLRCDKKYQFFTFQEGVDYQIPASWGSCNLEVLAAADIEFEVVQFGIEE